MQVVSIQEWRSCDAEQPIYEAENSETPYSKKNFLVLCEGDELLAYELFCQCEWQCPETILDEEGGIEAFKANFGTSATVERQHN